MINSGINILLVEKDRGQQKKKKLFYLDLKNKENFV